MTENNQISLKTLIAVSSIIFSTSIMAIASGLMFAYVPIKLLDVGFEPWVVSSLTPAVAFGGLVGCFAVGPLIRLTGHARIFMLFYALIVMSMVIIAAFTNLYAWLFARAIYGFCINGIFILALSWLHDASTDEIRGRVISIFYVGYVMALGLGMYMIGFIEIEGNTLPLVATFIVAVAMIPVALTRLPQPAPPDSISVDLKKVWSISPVGLAGMFTVGGVTMLLQNFAPIYARTLEYTKSDIGLLMLLMQVGLIFVQIPMGALSDRMDRRYILIFVSFGAFLAATIGYTSHGLLPFIALILVFAFWNGCNETMYSVSNALANDRADPKQYVMLSSTQMIAWSISGFVLPLMATIGIQYMPIEYFMVLCGTITAAFGLFVIYRMSIRSEKIDLENREPFTPTTAQVVNPGDFANPDVYDEDDAGISEGLVN